MRDLSPDVAHAFEQIRELSDAGGNATKAIADASGDIGNPSAAVAWPTSSEQSTTLFNGAKRVRFRPEVDIID